MARTRTDYIVIHCSATRAIQNIGVKEIRDWHVRGRGWADVGYHKIIRRDGKVENGRPIDQAGAHVAGHNANSIGICLVGGLNNDTYAPEANYTAAQWASLKSLVADMLKKYPKAKVLGHRDFPGVKKSCPCMSAKDWAKKNGFPAA